MPRRIAAYFNVVKTQWLVVLFIFSTQLAVAYTSYPVDVHCPIDSTEFTIFETRSYYLRGYLKDFQMVGAVGGYYRNVVHSCPKCHYSGYKSDFDTTFSEQERSTLLKILEPYKHYEMTEIQENEVAIAIKNHGKVKHSEIASLYLNSSYLIKEFPWRVRQRKSLQRNAIKYIRLAMQEKEYTEPKQYANMTYLMGELYRRLGHFKEALSCFDLARMYPNQALGMTDWIKKQRKLAKHKNRSNKV
ncbi:MAG: DUF2225 domain-containing protein [Flavobacteriales bacterium]|jgi:uncharacterized protein (DUF2225 family)